MFATMHPNNPPEAISREQAVVAYTPGSAYAEFAEKTKGTLAPGMLADLAVRLCELLDAGLELATKPGQGTTFRVILPSRYEKPAA